MGTRKQNTRGDDIGAAVASVLEDAGLCRKVLLEGLTDNWDELDKAENNVSSRMASLNDKAADAGSLVGRSYFEGVGDGYARYVVVRATSRHLWLDPVPLGDAWTSRWIEVHNGKVNRKPMVPMLEGHSRDAMFGRSSIMVEMSYDEFVAWKKKMKAKLARKKRNIMK